MFWTGDNRVLLCWDSGQGPSWAYDPEGKLIKAKLIGETEVWRATRDSSVQAERLGTTNAEGFLDLTAQNGACYWYWFMERLEAGGLRQVGPTLGVEMPTRPADPRADVTPPSPPSDLTARMGAQGVTLRWLPASDDESGVLAYFIYTDNGAQPEHIVWLDSVDSDSDAVYDLFLDRTGTMKTGYVMRAIDAALNLSEPCGKADVVPTKGTDTCKPQEGDHTQPWYLFEPYEPVTPEGGGFYVFDLGNHTNVIRTLSEDGETALFFGTPDAGWAHVDGSGSSVRLNGAIGGCVDNDGALWFTDYSHAVHKLKDGVLEHIAGPAAPTSNLPGFVDGTGTAARFNYPRGICLAGDGNFYVAEEDNEAIRKVTPEGVVTTLAGSSRTSAIVTSVAGSPGTITTSQDHHYITGDHVYISNHLGATPDLNYPTNGHTGYLVVVTGPTTFTLQTYPGGLDVAVTVGGTGGSVERAYAAQRDGVGPAARFNGPYGIVWSEDDSCLYVGETARFAGTNPAVRKVLLDGTVTTVWQGTEMVYPEFIALGPDGLLYLTDFFGYAVFSLDAAAPLPAPVLVAGQREAWGYADGAALGEARFGYLAGIHVDGDGAIWVVDEGNYCIRKVAGGVVTTVAGQHGVSGYAEGVGSAAKFADPWALVPL